MRLEETVEQASNRNGFSCSDVEGGWCVEVPLEGLRRQRVFITQGKSTDRVKLLSPCGPARPELALKLLEMNSGLQVGAFAISKVGQRQVTVLTETLPEELLSVYELEVTLKNIAKTADALEQKLNPSGEDQI